MIAVKYSKLRQNLKNYIKQAQDSSEPIYIEDNNTALVSLDYLESLEETLYQISNPANRKHLEKSIKEGEIGDKVFKYKNVTELADELGIDLD